MIDTIEKPVGLQEAADYLGRTKNALYILAHRGRVPYHKSGGKLYFFVSELYAWIKEDHAD